MPSRLACSLRFTNDVLKPVQLVGIDIPCRKLGRLNLPELKSKAGVVFRPFAPRKPFKRLICGRVKIVLCVSAFLGSVVDDIYAIIIGKWAPKCVLSSSIMCSLYRCLRFVKLRALDFG